jgi:hypothetical protein
MVTYNIADYEQYLDKPLIDFYKQIESLEMKKISNVSNSPLFNMLTTNLQDEIIIKTSRKDQIASLYRFYYRQELTKSSTKMFDLFHGQEAHVFNRLSKLSKETIESEDFILNYGTDALVGLMIQMLFVRYHDECGIGPFLLCYKYQDISDNQMHKCLWMSRLNYILNGKYLPIIYFRYPERHTNVTLYLPIVDDHGNTQWRIIFIDSDVTSDRIKFDDILRKQAHFEPHEIMKWFKQELEGQQHNEIRYEFSYCTQKIQQIVHSKEDTLLTTGNCAIWAHLLGFYILANSDTLYQQTAHYDFVSVYCENLYNDMLSQSKVGREFFELMSHFKVAMYNYVIYIRDLVNKSPRADKTSSIVHKILHGPKTQLVDLLLEIFNRFNINMQQFIKNGENLNLLKIRNLNRRIAKLMTASTKDEFLPEELLSIFPDLAVLKESLDGESDEYNYEEEQKYEEMFPEKSEDESESEDENIQKEREKRYRIRQKERSDKIEMQKIKDKEELANRLLQSIGEKMSHGKIPKSALLDQIKREEPKRQRQ